RIVGAPPCWGRPIRTLVRSAQALGGGLNASLPNGTITGGTMVRSYYTYDNWAEQQAAKGVPLYREYYVEDLRTIDLAPWDLRECNAAIIQFVDMEGVTEARVQEIP